MESKSVLKRKAVQKGQPMPQDTTVSESPSVTGYKAMSLDRAITLLKDRAEKCECDGECDAEKPYIKCQECEAARVLNEVNDIVRMAL